MKETDQLNKKFSAIVTIMVMIFMFFTLPKLQAQVQSINIEEGFVVYKTPKREIIEVPLSFHKDTKIEDVDLATLTALIDYTNNAMTLWLKSRRSYYPLYYIYKFKPKKSGKNKHSITLTYEGTNSYGGVVESFQQLEFNHKLKETVGSILLRS